MSVHRQHRMIPGGEAQSGKVSRLKYILEQEVERLEFGANSLPPLPSEEIISVLTETNDLMFRLSKKT